MNLLKAHVFLTPLFIVFENYLGGQFIVQANRCFSARDRTRCIAELLEDGVERAVLKLPESSLVAINQVLDYCSLVHSKTLPEANLATKAKQLAANSTQVQLYELATVPSLLSLFSFLLYSSVFDSLILVFSPTFLSPDGFRDSLSSY